jgi:hypothetical protein
MTILYIGSYARKIHGEDVAPKDIDLIADYESIKKFAKERDIKTFYPIEDGKKIFMRKGKQIYEAEVAYTGSLAEELLELVKHDPNSIVFENTIAASYDLLYTLKMSHRYLKNSPHFKKTKDDIIFFRSIGCTIPEIYQDWFIRREKATYFYRHPNLNQDKGSFFDTPGVTYKYDHDSIHQAIAILGKSAYTYFMKEGEEVACDQNKFNESTQFTKLAAVVEESCVLAIERSLVPFPGKMNPREAFLFALEKVCTSITSGWFREFAWENYYHAINLFDRLYRNYFVWFDSSLKEGFIKEHGQ